MGGGRRKRGGGGGGQTGRQTETHRHRHRQTDRHREIQRQRVNRPSALPVNRHVRDGARAAYRLVGLVVEASASRAEGPGFESRLRRDFFGVESYQ